METAWYVALAGMLGMYAVLDGFDLGVGALHRLLPRSEPERDEALNAIGPVWNGNEVWLVAAGGVLFLAFPQAYAAAFSGLYLGLIIVLWLLIGRGLGIELRHQVEHPLWRTACDTVFWLASAGLAVLFGVAFGNVIRGVPLNADGYFHLPLLEILNWYALLVGVFAFVLLVGHGATFLGTMAQGDLAARARGVARRVFWAQLLLIVGMVLPTYEVREEMVTSFWDHPWRLVFPLVVLGALVVLVVSQRAGAWRRAFIASSMLIAGLLATAAAALYPNVLPARDGRPFSLTIDNAASGETALRTALFWWPIGIALALVYFAYAYRLLFRRG